jgi:hypothetical protein
MKVVINNLAKTDVGKSYVVVQEYYVNNQLSFMKIKDVQGNEKVLPIELLYVDGENCIHNKYVYSWQSLRFISAGIVDEVYSVGDYTGIEKLCYTLTHIDNYFDIQLALTSPQIKIITLRSKPRKFSKEDIRLVETLIVLTIVTTGQHTGKYKLSTTISDDFYLDTKTTETAETALTNDPWIRSMLWTSSIITKLTDDMKPIYNIGQRIKWAKFIRKQLQEIQSIVLDSTNDTKDEPDLLKEFPYITVCVNAWSMPLGRIAKYVHPIYYPGDEKLALVDFETNPKATMRFYGELTIHESVFNNIVKTQTLRKSDDKHHYYKYILIHEMIHAIFRNESTHGEKFQKIAKTIGLPKKYQN